MLLGGRYHANVLGRWWWQSALLIAAVSTIAIIALPIGVWRWLGAVALVALFLAILTMLAANLFAASLRVGYPLSTLLIVFVAVLSALDLNNNHRLVDVETPALRPTKSSPPASNTNDIASHFQRWIRSRPDRAQFSAKSQKYPIYVVAAQGGGIYAAYHTASTLANLQDLCPTFAAHVFAMSSVSGGSLGSTAFRATLTPADIRSEACKEKDRSFLSEAVAKVLDADYLSPLIAYFLFPDFLQDFIPLPIGAFDRSLGLERVFVDQIERLPTGNGGVLKLPYVAHWQPTGLTPALVFNTTEVKSGQRRVNAPFTFPSTEIGFLPVWGGPGAVAPSLATAAIVSARFPWLTPSAWFDEGLDNRGSKPLSHRRIRLVDGAYFENSGVSTAHDLIRALDNEVDHLGLADQVEIYLLVFTTSDVDQDTASTDRFTDLLDPIRTLLNTRAARARAAIARAEEELGAYQSPKGPLPRVRRFPLEALGLPLPLGWQISSATKIMIEMQIGDWKRCSKDPGEVQRFAADCVVRQIYDELNSALK